MTAQLAPLLHKLTIPPCIDRTIILCLIRLRLVRGDLKVFLADDVPEHCQRLTILVSIRAGREAYVSPLWVDAVIRILGRVAVARNRRRI